MDQNWSAIGCSWFSLAASCRLLLGFRQKKPMAACVGHSSKLPGVAVIELSVQHYTNKASDVVQSPPEKKPLWQIQVKQLSMMRGHQWPLSSSPSYFLGPGWAQHLNIYCRYYIIFTSIYSTIFMFISQNFMWKLFVFVYLSTYIYNISRYFPARAIGIHILFHCSVGCSVEAGKICHSSTNKQGHGGPGATPRFFSILKSSFLWNL